MSAGPERLKAAVAKKIPQLIAPGALDMVNFGPANTVPARFTNRKLYPHNPQITLMRTTPEENAAFADFMTRNLAGADPEVVKILLPTRGVSELSREGAPFADPDADRALRETLESRLNGRLPIIAVDAHINDEAFAHEVTACFLANWTAWRSQRSQTV